MAMPRILFAVITALPVAGQGLLPRQPTRTATPPHAFVRILPGAKVTVGSDAEVGGQALTKATITVEDGTRRSAKLVEFQ